MKTNHLLLTVLIIFAAACSDKEENNVVPDNEPRSGWLVSEDHLIINENSHDRILSIDEPVFTPAADADLRPEDEVLVYQVQGEVRIYPVNTIWHHEIVNDGHEGQYFTVSYCPITGSGVAWNREINGKATTFGVSGHLYNNNLVPYDRETESYWSQMDQLGIKGKHGGETLEWEPLLHTRFATILEAYPDALVLNEPAGGHVCDSVCYTKTGLKNSADLSSSYFGIIGRNRTLLFHPEQFPGQISLVHILFEGKKLIVAGSADAGFITAFVNPGNTEMQALQNSLPKIMTDGRGNVYDVMGNITDGPDKGSRLKMPFSYTAKEFAWILFSEEISFY